MHAVQVQAMVDHNITVTAEIVRTAAVSYLEENNLYELLEGRGGRFKAGYSWCCTLLREMNLTRHKCTTQASQPPDKWVVQQRWLELKVCQHVYGCVLCKCSLSCANLPSLLAFHVYKHIYCLQIAFLVDLLGPVRLCTSAKHL